MKKNNLQNHPLLDVYTGFSVSIANERHLHYAEQIVGEMMASAIARGTGIAKRSPEFIRDKMRQGKAVIALTENEEWAGFAYIEAWENGRYVSNSGLIISPAFRKLGLARAVKNEIFALSRRKYPNAKIFGLTTSKAVMKINLMMQYEPVVYDDITKDEKFWEGCKSCVNYAILESKNRGNCLCTAMMFDPASQSHTLQPVN
jgi:hypothetical protein